MSDSSGMDSICRSCVSRVRDFLQLSDAPAERKGWHLTIAFSESQQAKKSPGLQNPGLFLWSCKVLVPVVIWFKRTFEIHTDILGLFRVEAGQLGSKAFEVKFCYFFVQMFRKGVNVDFVVICPIP